jgi:hypothetical protein
MDRPPGGSFLLLSRDIIRTSHDEQARIRREVLRFIISTLNLMGISPRAKERASPHDAQSYSICLSLAENDRRLLLFQFRPPNPAKRVYNLRCLP